MIDENLFKQFAESSLQVRKVVSRRSSMEFSMPQFLTLHLIVGKTTDKDEEYNVSQITNQTDMAMPNVVRMLNEMQMKGYIKRRRDGRNVYISITEEGRVYHDHCLEVFDGHIKELIDALKDADVSDDEINEFMATAVKLHDVYGKMLAKQSNKE